MVCSPLYGVALTIWKVINCLIKEIPNRLDLCSLPTSQCMTFTFIPDPSNQVLLILCKLINNLGELMGSVCITPSTFHQGIPTILTLPTHSYHLTPVQGCFHYKSISNPFQFLISHPS